MIKKRFHLLGIPHTISNSDYISCAYTQKAVKLSAMLKSLGHEVFYYGVEGADVDATEVVNVMNKEMLWKTYPLDQQAFFKFDITDEYHKEYYLSCIKHIFQRFDSFDFILCPWGWGHEPITRPFVEHKAIIVESGIGLNSFFAPYKVFESYAIMQEAYGKAGIEHGIWNDAVIPNYFDPNDFYYREAKAEWGIYLGRITSTKNVAFAADLANRTKQVILFYGNGDPIEAGIQESEYVKIMGFADKETRRRVLSEAKFLILPTSYLEPFGGVVIEANMSGTPVITSDWGAFPEIVVQGKTGYRCRSLAQFVKAIHTVGKLSTIDCRNWAMDNYSTDVVKLMYDEYFENIYFQEKESWYNTQKNPDLNVISKTYPS